MGDVTEEEEELVEALGMDEGVDATVATLVGRTGGGASPLDFKPPLNDSLLLMSATMPATAAFGVDWFKTGYKLDFADVAANLAGFPAPLPQQLEDPDGVCRLSS